VRWPPACEDVSLEAEECPLFEDVTKQSTEAVTENTKFFCDSDLITNPNPVYSHSIT
jgi:hypothetical protein